MTKSLARQIEADADSAVALVYQRLERVLEFSEEGVRQLEEIPEWGEDEGGLLDEMAMTAFLMKEEKPLETLAVMFGGFLGEVFRRLHGGEWVLVDTPSGKAAALQVAGGTLFPHQKVLKRLEELREDSGDEHNVWGYYQVMKDLYGRPKKPPRRRGGKKPRPDRPNNSA